MEKDSYVKIILDQVELNVRIGLHDHEKEGGRSQRIIVDVALYIAPRPYLKDVTHKTIIDYDHIYKALQDWADRPHTLLIETYINELLELCFQDERIEACCVALSKPDIYEDVARAGVEVFMTRTEYQSTSNHARS